MMLHACGCSKITKKLSNNFVAEPIRRLLGGICGLAILEVSRVQSAYQGNCADGAADGAGDDFTQLLVLRSAVKEVRKKWLIFHFLRV